MEQDVKEVKMYSDFKSPYAFLAFDPAFALEDKHRISSNGSRSSCGSRARASAAGIPNTR
jgi:hypothetical protein